MQNVACGKKKRAMQIDHGGLDDLPVFDHCMTRAFVHEDRGLRIVTLV